VIEVTVHLEIVSFTHPHVVTIQNTMTFFFYRFFFFWPNNWKSMGFWL